METQHYCIYFVYVRFVHLKFSACWIIFSVSASIVIVCVSTFQHLSIQYWGINVKRFDVSLILFVIILYNVSLSVLSSITFNVAKNNNQINVTDFGLVCVQFIHISPLIFPANSTYFIEYCIFWNHLDREKKENIFRFCIFVLHDCMLFTKVTKHLHMCVYFI